MKLTLTAFTAFSQGGDIKADIKGGWCAGLTGLVSEEVGQWDSGLGSAGDWVANVAYKTVTDTLSKINRLTDIAESLQGYLRSVQDKIDVSAQIHKSAFNGRGCKVLLCAGRWFPLFGYVSYYWQSKWQTNHVGYIVRGDDKLLLFDPNYGTGVFSITDSAPLTLADVNGAINTLAWKSGFEPYLMSSTVAKAVIDEGGFRTRFSVETMDNLSQLVEFAKKYQSV
jgi:hypothetical protein